MLSFDITDRNIRIIKGTESGNKIRISSAATLELEEEIIVNGHVKDIPRLAMLINGILKNNKMADKEAIISISSNLTIFKELKIAKAKEQEFAKNVKSEMQSSLGIDDTYSISYIIIDEGVKDETSGQTLCTVLATACPYAIIDCYKEVCRYLSISLKSAMIGCNCITKLLLADTKIKSKMPLLAVQIDKNFISLNLYEKGQLSFSRFAAISAEDYGDSDDYVFEAVNENIFRMLQFHRSRNSGETIENIILYGDTTEYNRLTQELSNAELNVSTLIAPAQIHGYQNLEFALYANAIGAMFKRNKDTEKINLLETDTINNNKLKSDTAYPMILLSALVGSAVIVGGIYGFLAIKNNSIVKETDQYQSYLDSPDTAQKLEQFDKLTVMSTAVEDYYSAINNLNDAFESQPKVLGSEYERYEELVLSVAEELSVTNAMVLSPQYANGVFNMEIKCDGTNTSSSKLPAEFVAQLSAQDEIANVSYSNYSVTIEQSQEEVSVTDPETGEVTTTTSTDGDEKIIVQFSLQVTLKGNTIYTPEDAEALLEAEGDE